MNVPWTDPSPHDLPPKDCVMAPRLQEFKRSLRGLAARPAFALVAVVTVALGVGANALVFSVVDAVVLDALPFPDPSRLVRVEGIRTTVGTTFPLSYLDIDELDRSATGFDGIVARTGARSFNLLADGHAENVVGELVESRYFEFLGIEPVVGRLLGPTEDLEGEHRVAVLGHGLWTRRFGMSPEVVGSVIELDGRTFEVAGVASEGFKGLTDEADLWLPMTMAPTLYQPFYLAARQFRWLSALARLSPGVTLDAAQAELDARTATLREMYPQANLEIGARVTPLADLFFGDLRPRLLLLWGASAFVLLIAAANLAALLLARGTARGHETALRAALGAGRLELAAHRVTEGVTIAVVGALAGVGMAAVVVGPVVRLAAVGIPGFVDASLDARVVVVMFVVSLGVAALAALLPAILASRTSALAAMAREGRGQEGGRGRLTALRAFVVGQVAVALVLVVAVGLAAQGFSRLVNAEMGFDVEGVALATVDLKAPRFAENDAYWGFAESLQQRAVALPGVSAAALVGPQGPVGAWNAAEVSVERRMEQGLDPSGLMAITHSVTPGYFAAMGIPLLAGRDFSSADRDAQETPLVVVVNEAFADRYFEGSAVGQRIKLARPDQNGPMATVVGVVGDVVDGGPGAEPRPTELQLYYSLFQVTPRLPPTLTLVARTLRDTQTATEAVIPDLRTLTEGWAGDVPLFRLSTLRGRMREQVASQRFLVWLMSAFAFLAVGLAAVGLYGVMSYTVGRQVREFGVRLALGADPGEVLRLVLSRSLILAASGVGVGIVLAVAASRLLAANLHGVSATDPRTFVLSAVGVLTVSVASALVPALRAARTDPVASLGGDG